LRVSKSTTQADVYLVDTDVISEARKGNAANAGVRAFFRKAGRNDEPLYLSAITVGEIRRGIERLRHRGDRQQAGRLERWLALIIEEYGDAILSLDAEVAQVWGRLRVPQPENPIDKQIAATALIHDLTVVTRNVADFATTGVRLMDPFDR
jgi:predicted nucleic acid-binding protein